MATFWERAAHLVGLTIYPLCILTICNYSFPVFGFEGWIWVLIASVPGLCILLTYKNSCIHIDKLEHASKTFETSANYYAKYMVNKVNLLGFKIVCPYCEKCINVLQLLYSNCKMIQ